MRIMRSGLQKPGTVPFLALVLFSLLSLVPTLAKQWEFCSVHLAYLGLSLPRYEGLAVGYSRAGNVSNSIDTRPPSRQRVTSGSIPCKSWLLGDFYWSCVERDMPLHQQPVMGTPPHSSLFEAGTEPGDGAVTYAASKETSSLTRGVSAFKEFVVRRWDDQQMIQLSPQHGLRDMASTQPLPTVVNSITAVPSEESGQSGSESEADTAESTEASLLLLRLPTILHETWQQVCHAGEQYLESLSRSTNHNKSLILHDPAPAIDEKHARLDDSQLEGSRPPAKAIPSNHDSVQSEQDPLYIPPPNQLVLTAGQWKDTELTRDSEHMRGSSMAIVIGLIAGIMWF